MIDHGTLPSIAGAKLPPSYMAAIAALKMCAKHFTPESYLHAVHALQRCADHDECATWPEDAQTLASYARMAGDDSLPRLVRKVERARRAWAGGRHD